LEKNGLLDYKVLHLDTVVNDEALASFDHILMAEIEKSNLDESVTQSNTYVL